MDIEALEKRLSHLASVETKEAESVDRGLHPQLHHQLEIEALHMRHTLKANLDRNIIRFARYFGRCILPHFTRGQTGLDFETLKTKLPLEGDYKTNREGPNPSKALSRERSLGGLGTLPNEIIDSIVTYLDLESLTKLKLTNTATRYLVTNSRDYHFVFKHAPQALRAPLALKVGAFVGPSRLRELLQTYECAACGNFGRYLYLPTLERACRSCIMNSARFFTLTTIQAGELLGVDKEELTPAVVTTLPTLCPVHLRVKTHQQERTELTNWYYASQVSKDKYGTIDEMYRQCLGTRRILYPPLNMLPCYEHEFWSFNIPSLRCSVDIPMIGMPTEQFSASKCAGCRDAQIFETSQDFIKHFVYCKEALSLIIRKMRDTQSSSEWKAIEGVDYSAVLAKQSSPSFNLH